MTDHLALTIALYNDRVCDLYYSTASKIHHEWANDITPDQLGVWLDKSMQLSLNQKYKCMDSDLQLLFRILCENETNNASNVFITQHLYTPLSQKIDLTGSSLGYIDWIYVCDFRWKKHVQYMENKVTGKFNLVSLVHCTPLKELKGSNYEVERF